MNSPDEGLYADQVIITLRVTGDFRFPELAVDDGEQVVITLPGDGWDWNPRELRDAVKQRVLDAESEPFRVTDRYVEVEAGASQAFWELLVEFGSGTLKDVGVPALVAYLVSRVSRAKQKSTSDVGDAVCAMSDEEFRAGAISSIADRYGRDAVRDIQIHGISWREDGSVTVSAQLSEPDMRQFEVGIKVDKFGTMRTVSMTRFRPGSQG